MNLDNILNKKLTKTLYKDIKRPCKKKTKEQRDAENIRYVIRLIKTGDFNPDSKSHCILLALANKHGYVDKKTLTILKEE